MPFGNNHTHNKHNLHLLSLVQLLYLLLVQLFPNHTRVHVITLQIRLGMAQMSLHKYPADLYVCINVSPKGGYWGAPPTFLALYPLIWSLECIKLFDVFHSYGSRLDTCTRLCLIVVVPQQLSYSGSSNIAMPLLFFTPKNSSLHTHSEYSIFQWSYVFKTSIFRHWWLTVSTSVRVRWRPTGGEECPLHTVPIATWSMLITFIKFVVQVEICNNETVALFPGHRRNGLATSAS